MELTRLYIWRVFYYSKNACFWHQMCFPLIYRANSQGKSITPSWAWESNLEKTNKRPTWCPRCHAIGCFTHMKIKSSLWPWISKGPWKTSKSHQSSTWIRNPMLQLMGLVAYCKVKSWSCWGTKIYVSNSGPHYNKIIFLGAKSNLIECHGR